MEKNTLGSLIWMRMTRFITINGYPIIGECSSNYLLSVDLSEFIRYPLFLF